MWTTCQCISTLINMMNPTVHAVQAPPMEVPAFQEGLPAMASLLQSDDSGDSNSDSDSDDENEDRDSSQSDEEFENVRLKAIHRRRHHR